MKLQVIYYAADEELYDTLQLAHISIGHGGRDRMIEEINKNIKI